jgi:hypothetical protein
MTGSTFRDKRGRLLEVESTSHEGTDLGELRRRTVSNLAYAYARAKLGLNSDRHTEEVHALEHQVADGLRAWQHAQINIDGTPTPFDVLILGQGYCVAVGRSPEAVIALRSHGVPLSEIALVRDAPG